MGYFASGAVCGASLALEGLTARLAGFGAELTYERLPAESVRALKRMLLDSLGTALAGSTLGAGVGELLAVVRQAGEPRESSVLGCGFKAPAMMAALANGGLAHALNYDDSLGGLGLHLGVTSVPAALAVAERAGGISGKELLAALAAGNEILARLGRATYGAAQGYTETRPQSTQMLGYFNAALCAGRVARLTSERMHSALGLAHMQASGGRQPVLEGCDAKALYASFPNQGGVLSALLAQQGLDGRCAALEGEAGLFATSFPGDYSDAELEDGLGEIFLLEGVAFKSWPTTAVAHVFIEAAITLAMEHNLRPKEVVAITLRGEPHIRTFCEPAAVRQAPRSSVEAEDSIPFATAKALVNRTLGLADFKPAALAEPEALRLASLTSYDVDESLGKAGVLEVTTTDGAILRQRVDRPLGQAPRALGDTQLEAKFRDCAGHALVPLSPRAVDAMIGAVQDLESLADVRELLAILEQ
jgi:2-methylcitrate dehydratase PrpD